MNKKYPCEGCGVNNVTFQMLRFSAYCFPCQVVSEIKKYGYERAIALSMYKRQQFNISIENIKEKLSVWESKKANLMKPIKN